MLWPIALGRLQGILGQSGQVQVHIAPEAVCVHAGSHGHPIYIHRLAYKNSGFQELGVNFPKVGERLLEGQLQEQQLMAKDEVLRVRDIFRDSELFFEVLLLKWPLESTSVSFGPQVDIKAQRENVPQLPPEKNWPS